MRKTSDRGHSALSGLHPSIRFRVSMTPNGRCDKASKVGSGATASSLTSHYVRILYYVNRADAPPVIFMFDISTTIVSAPSAAMNRHTSASRRPSKMEVCHLWPHCLARKFIQDSVVAAGGLGFRLPSCDSVRSSIYIYIYIYVYISVCVRVCPSGH